jgi:hypothetical protein
VHQLLTQCYCRNALKVTGFLLGIALSGCSTAEPSFDLLHDLPVPEEAREIQRIYLGNSRNNQQQFFIFDAKYPSLDVLHGYVEFFSKRGWIGCEPSMSTWDHYLDQSDGKAVLTHQVSGYWTNPDRTKLALVVGRYYSSGITSTTVPDNNEQRWSVLIQQNLDVDAEVKRLSKKCR